MEHRAGCPYWSLAFAEDGTLEAGASRSFLDEVAATDVRDLFVLSHGWNTGRDDAEELYTALVPLVADAAGRSPALGPLGFAGVHWPALWFPDRPATEPAGAGGGDAQTTQPGMPVQPASGDADLSGGEIAATLGASFDDEHRSVVDRLGALIDEGLAAAASGTEPDARQRVRLDEFHRLLQGLVPDTAETTMEDRGEAALLSTEDPERDYAFLADQFGGAAVEGSAQGVRDVFRSAWRGAKDALRVTSYFVMKARAGAVGRNGLGPLLVDLHRAGAAPEVRVHLLGHSFGGRLVAFALAGMPSASSSPVASLLLVQAAFSHYSFSGARDNPFGEAGALQKYADRVHGPLVATYSEHDWAVGRWYPRASALARQDNQANPEVSRWGGLGGGGFQAVAPLDTVDLRESGSEYDFTSGHFYGVDGSAVINDWRQSAFAGAHSDIVKPEVAWLAASAAAVSAGSAMPEPGPG